MDFAENGELICGKRTVVGFYPEGNPGCGFSLYNVLSAKMYSDNNTD